MRMGDIVVVKRFVEDEFGKIGMVSRIDELVDTLPEDIQRNVKVEFKDDEGSIFHSHFSADDLLIMVSEVE